MTRRLDIHAAGRRTVDLTIALLVLAYVRYKRARYAVRDLTRRVGRRR